MPLVQSNANTSSPTAASVPTHRYASDDSWPTVLGIVPVSELLAKNLSTKQKILCSDEHKHLIAHRRLCSNSQVRKRRQLAHGARNRASQ
jgi:hypothetical protein